jgi:hypothetical protein
LLATIPKNVDKKNIGNVYEKCWKIIGNFSEKCWRKNVGTTSKIVDEKNVVTFLKNVWRSLKKKNVATFKKSWQKIVDEIKIS